MGSCDENHKVVHPGLLQVESPALDGQVWSKMSNSVKVPAKVLSLPPCCPTRGSSVTKELNIFQPDSDVPSHGLLPYLKTTRPYMSKAVFCCLINSQIMMLPFFWYLLLFSH